jgi:hypothetical protein
VADRQHCCLTSLLSVPVASRSPGRRLQPPAVWCAIIWGSVQYSEDRLLRVTVVGCKCNQANAGWHEWNGIAQEHCLVFGSVKRHR